VERTGVDITSRLSAAKSAILRGLNETALRKQSVEQNVALVAEQAEITHNMVRVAELYEKIG
jgi:hypothetical protein